MDKKHYLTKEEIIESHGLKVFKEFEEFMFGQTVLVLDDGANGYYVWDFESFLCYKKYKPVCTRVTD